MCLHNLKNVTVFFFTLVLFYHIQYPVIKCVFYSTSKVVNFREFDNFFNDIFGFIFKLKSTLYVWNMLNPVFYK